jgi:hypothetical protein
MSGRMRKMGGRPEPSTSRRSLLRTPNLVGAVAAIAALAGTVLALGLATAEPVVTAGNEARSGELSLWVASSEWLDHDHTAHEHDDSDEHGDGLDPNEVPVDNYTDVVQGFQMPGSMMPGTPDEGFQRLQVSVNLTNRGHADTHVGPDDFVLVGANGATWTPLLGGTFVPMTIPAGHGFGTVVAFDVPGAAVDDGVYVEWNWAGIRTQLTLTETDGHDHG